MGVVPLTSFDTLLRRFKFSESSSNDNIFDRFHLAKVDIEGHEKLFFEGFSETFKNAKALNNFILEYTPELWPHDDFKITENIFKLLNFPFYDEYSDENS